MDPVVATEVAYKNGYKDGYAAAYAEILKLITDNYKNNSQEKK
jgi:hypothetical protein